MEDTKQKAIQINLQRPDQDVLIPVRFPTDAELLERQGKRRTTIRNFRKEATVTNEGIDDGNLDLLKKIMTNPVEVDKFEATKIVDGLLEAEVTEVESQSNGVLVTLETAVFGILEFQCRKPSAEEQLRFSRESSSVRLLPIGSGQTVKINLRAGEQLFDAICEGAKSSTNILFKHIVATAVDSFLKQGVAKQDF